MIDYTRLRLYGFMSTAHVPCKQVLDKTTLGVVTPIRCAKSACWSANGNVPNMANNTFTLHQSCDIDLAPGSPISGSWVIQGILAFDYAGAARVAKTR